MIPKLYRTKVKQLAGTSYSEVISKARAIYKNISSKTKRRPYIRSKYFNKEKVFLDYYWGHIMTKNMNDRFRRMKFYACAIDLIENSKLPPDSRISKEKPTDILHRFYGQSVDNKTFIVQIKENIKNHEKSFISVFPED